METTNLDWKSSFNFTRAIVHYVYLSTMILNGVLCATLPTTETVPYEKYKLVFYSFIALSILTFPLAYVIYRRYLTRERLEKMAYLTGGLNSATTAFKIGCIVSACIGDMSGVVGSIFFAYSRSFSGLFFFLGAWAIQYGLGMLWLAKGKQHFESLANTLQKIQRPRFAPSEKQSEFDLKFLAESITVTN